MSALTMQWALLPTPVKLALWIGLGVAFAAVLWRLLPATKARRIVPLAYLVVHFGSPYAYSWIRDALADYHAAREAWLAATCRTLSSARNPASAEPLQAEGILIVADYDRLTNERFQRVAALEKGNNGDITVVDTGKYEPHPIRRTFPGGTFAQMAYALLTQKRFSYIEFEMLPQGSGKGYSNAGLLNTTAWTGPRYRRYYLAPGDHRHCVRETGEAPQVSGSAVLGSVHDSLAAPPRRQAKPVCLALEIVDAPLSKLRIAADEPVERLRWQARIRGITVPAWTTIRGDRIQVLHERSELYRYFGFDYPNELEPRYHCQSNSAASRIVGSVLTADVGRAFYRSKDWYAGSAVQTFYEPEKVQLAAIETKPPPRTPATADSQCPPRPAARSGAVVADQLEDFTSPRGARSVQSKIGGSQPASLFSLSRDASISTLAWSGFGASAGDKFLIRIYRDADGMPGAMVHELETAASARSAGKWISSRTHVFEAKLGDVKLGAGNYWLSVLTSRSARSDFFWAFEPEGEQPKCGSGGVLRHYETGKWGGQDGSSAGGVSSAVAYADLPPPPPRSPVVPGNARGFSFRMEVK